MPAANIEINAVATTGVDVAINVAVQLSNADVGGETTYAWTILDQPEGSADALSNPAIENPQFTPTSEGSYFLRLVVNAGGGVNEKTAYAVVGVRQARSDLRVPAAGEALQHDTVDGWKTAMARWCRLVDKFEGGIVIAGAGAGVAVGSIVRINASTRTILAGLPGASILPEATLAAATSAALVSGDLGVVIAVCDGAAIAAGKAVKVRMLGLVENTEPGAPVVGDFVYADNAGEPSLTVGTVPVIVGRVVSVGGGVYRWAITPSLRLERRPTSPVEAVMLDGSGSWAIGGAGTSTLYWTSVVGTATGLHYPLRVNVGEVLYRLEADVVVANVANLVTATLMKGRGFGGGGVASGLATSPAALGDQVWNITPGAPLALPQELPAGFAFWLYPQTNAGGNARFLGNVTAFVRPA